jgi:hypothetical protein
MADKISVKTAFIVFFLYGIVLALCACMVPVDVPAFFKDETIQQVIEATNVAVKITGDNADIAGLEPGNRKITGLDPNKYYMVEKEVDAGGVDVTITPSGSNYPLFVTDYTGYGPGGLTEFIELITTISGKTINGLTNFHTYTIRATRRFSTVITYSDDGIGGVTNEPITVTNGKIVIPVTRKGNITLNLYNELGSTAYHVMALAVSSTPHSTTWGTNKETFNSWTAFSVEDEGKAVDYVFIEVTNPSGTAPVVTPVTKFKVLRVEFAPQPPSGVKLTLQFTVSDASITPSSTAPVTYSDLADGTKSLTFTLAGGAFTGITWDLDGTAIGAGTTLTIDSSSTYLAQLAVGIHRINVKGLLNSVPYSAFIQFEVQY